LEAPWTFQANLLPYFQYLIIKENPILLLPPFSFFMNHMH
jgi:hypothetical protein